jgi:hypothetical protein
VPAAVVTATATKATLHLHIWQTMRLGSRRREKDWWWWCGGGVHGGAR